MRRPRLSARLLLPLTILLGFLLTLASTWQLVVVAAVLAGVLSPSLRRAIVVGAGGVIVAWALLLLWQAAVGPVATVSALLGAILGLTSAAPILPIVLTLVLGGVLGAGGGMVGAGLARLWVSEPDHAGPT